MGLSNEQIKKILDEAPEGATHWCVHVKGDLDSEYGFSGYCLRGGKFTSAVWNQVPLSDLRKQLEGEWINGLPPIGVECEYNCCNPLYSNNERHHGEILTCVAHVGLHGQLAVLVSRDFSFSTVCNSAWVKKIETEAEKAERERLEAAYDLYRLWRGENQESFESFSKCNVDNWLAIVDKTNYRKEVG